MATRPLSLEDLCLLDLICHLEDYPPAALASLPLHLRRRLLLNLPVVDICQLEDTTAIEGINMEVKVWREIQDQSFKTCNAESSTSFKTSFFNKTLSCILQGDITAAGDHLLAVHGPLRDHIAPVVSVLYPTGTPSRHIKGTTEERFIMHVVYALVNQCKFLPESVSFKCDDLASTNLWKQRNMVLFDLLGSLLCEIKSLKFTAESSDAEFLNIPQSILELIFSRPVTTLISLSLDGDPDFVLHTVANAELFFAPIRCTQDQNFLQSLYPQLRSCSLPYSRLTSLDIQGCDELSATEQATLQDNLNSIVLNQTALESVNINCRCSIPFSNTVEFFTTLGRLFYEPQFKVLRLDGVDLDWNALVALIPPFLTSPISPGRKQELHFKGNFFLLDEPFPLVHEKFDVCSMMPGKMLQFENIYYADHPKYFLQWLAEFSIPSMLSSFEFYIHNLDDQPPEVLGTVMSLLKSETSTALLESFSVSYGPLFLGPSPEVPFSILFGAMQLKKVSFYACDIDSKLPVLTQGLRKQLTLGVLEELSLNCNRLGRSSDGDFQDFADVVFCLPQLAKLKLSLKYNQLKSHHFTMLYCGWRCSTGRTRIKTLDIAGNDYQDHASLLQQVAISGDFVTY